MALIGSATKSVGSLSTRSSRRPRGRGGPLCTNGIWTHCRRSVRSSSARRTTTTPGVNSRALALEGVTRDAPNPSGGTIVRDASGKPTGLRCSRPRPAATSTQRCSRLWRPTESSPPARNNSGVDRLSTGIAKVFMDGVIEYPAQTAALLEPFVSTLDKAGWQVHARAIGDRAVRTALTVLPAVAVGRDELLQRRRPAAVRRRGAAGADLPGADAGAGNHGRR